MYRARDQDGNLVDSKLSAQRDRTAARAFFAQAKEMVGPALEQVITDGHTPYSRAMAKVLGSEVKHEPVGCVANPMEQDHRGVKQRYYPLLGFKALAAAQRFCRVFEEVHQYLRPRQRMGQLVSLAQRRAPVLAWVAERHSLFRPLNRKGAEPPLYARQAL